jgi:hypothetical protein
MDDGMSGTVLIRRGVQLEPIVLEVDLTGLSDDDMKSVKNQDSDEKMIFVKSENEHNMDDSESLSETSACDEMEFELDGDGDIFFHPYDISQEAQFLGIEHEAAGIERGKTIALEFKTIAKSAKLGDANILDECEGLSKYKPPEYRIAFLGDMGQGKSSTINSILNCEEVA